MSDEYTKAQRRRKIRDAQKKRSKTAKGERQKFDHTFKFKLLPDEQDHGRSR